MILKNNIFIIITISEYIIFAKDKIIWISKYRLDLLLPEAYIIFTYSKFFEIVSEINKSTFAFRVAKWLSSILSIFNSLISI